MNLLKILQDKFNSLSKPQKKATFLVSGGLLTYSLIRCIANGPMCKINKDLTGQIVIVTGANSGIGVETARRFIRLGATVILACRDQKRSQPVIDEFKKQFPQSSDKIIFMTLDLSDFDSILAFGQQFNSKFDKLDILVANAGVMAIQQRQLTKQDHEMQFGTNHLGHAFLIHLLQDKLHAAKEARIVCVSSTAHMKLPQSFAPESGQLFFDDYNMTNNYHPWTAYSQSKLANVIYAKGLAEDFKNKNKNIKVVSLHPGGIVTNLQNHVLGGSSIKTAVWNAVGGLLCKSIVHGAQTSIQCALVDFDKLENGGYYEDCRVKTPNPEALKEESKNKLFQYTQQTIYEYLEKQKQ